MEDIITRIKNDYPDLSFVEGSSFSWHAQKKHVSYKKTTQEQPNHNSWALLHELGHALLGHTDYTNDVELLQMEVSAWHKAKTLAKHYGPKIDDDYIEDCLDTYRDWLHLRSTCPVCFARSLQSTTSVYRCYNCQATWQVSRSRLCRPYRLQKAK
ncbi:MAG: hypothetical protein ABI220_03645 [Candidatus Saccharimonadales bacterium]